MVSVSCQLDRLTRERAFWAQLWVIILSLLIDLGRSILTVGGIISWAGDPEPYNLEKANWLLTSILVNSALNNRSSVTSPCLRDSPALKDSTAELLSSINCILRGMLSQQQKKKWRQSTNFPSWCFGVDQHARNAFHMAIEVTNKVTKPRTHLYKLFSWDTSITLTCSELCHLRKAGRSNRVCVVMAIFPAHPPIWFATMVIISSFGVKTTKWYAHVYIYSSLAGVDSKCSGGSGSILASWIFYKRTPYTRWLKHWKCVSDSPE